MEDNAALRAENALLRAEHTRLKRARASLLESGPATVPVEGESVPPRLSGDSADGGLAPVDTTSSAAEKIALFRALFAGREDVYAARWVSTTHGRSGWSPAEERPFDKTKDPDSRVFWPMTEQVLYGHLSGAESGRGDGHVGIYPLLTDHSCRLLVCDFDSKDGSEPFRVMGGDVV